MAIIGNIPYFQTNPHWFSDKDDMLSSNIMDLMTKSIRQPEISLSYARTLAQDVAVARRIPLSKNDLQRKSLWQNDTKWVYQMLRVTNQNALNLQDHCDTEDKCSASIGPGFFGFCRLVPHSPVPGLARRTVLEPKWWASELMALEDFGDGPMALAKKLALLKGSNYHIAYSRFPEYITVKSNMTLNRARRIDLPSACHSNFIAKRSQTPGRSASKSGQWTVMQEIQPWQGPLPASISRKKSSCLPGASRCPKLSISYHIF